MPPKRKKNTSLATRKAVKKSHGASPHQTTRRIGTRSQPDPATTNTENTSGDNNTKYVKKVVNRNRGPLADSSSSAQGNESPSEDEVPQATNTDGNNNTAVEAEDTELQKENSPDISANGRKKTRTVFHGPHCVALINAILAHQPHFAPHRTIRTTWEAVQKTVEQACGRSWDIGTLQTKAKALVHYHKVRLDFSHKSVLRFLFFV